MTEKTSNLWTSLLVALIVAVVTSLVNYIVLKDQWQWQLKEKSFQNRYELLKETATICSRYQQAREGTIVYALILKGKTQDIPKTDIERLSRIGKELNSLIPEEFLAYNESYKIFPQLKGHIEIVRTFFGPKTKTALDEYIKTTRKMPDEYLDEYVKQHRSYLKKDKHGREYVDPEMTVFAHKAEEEMNAALSIVLTAMREELGVRESNP